MVFYTAQYPVRWTAQNALHFLPPLADLFILTPTRLLRESILAKAYKYGSTTGSLREQWVPEKCVRLVKDTYEDARTRVKTSV